MQGSGRLACSCVAVRIGTRHWRMRRPAPVDQFARRHPDLFTYLLAETSTSHPIQKRDIAGDTSVDRLQAMTSDLTFELSSSVMAKMTWPTLI